MKNNHVDRFFIVHIEHSTMFTHTIKKVDFEEIEDKIIIPTLQFMQCPDENLYSFDSIDKYFDEIVFVKKELVCTTPDRRFNKYYDCTKWLERLQTKMNGVQLEAVLDENAYDLKPKGSSFWYIRVTRDNITRAAIMGFSHGFINWLNDVENS